MTVPLDPERSPLLADRRSSPKHLVHPLTSSTAAHGSGLSGTISCQTPSRPFENDVLPETSNLGRNITWKSAYIIVVSRVIGSGIFATPGSILKSVGSPGLSILVWVIGALVSACSISVFLEYGCMFPRSGGQKVYLEFTFRYPRLLASTFVAVNVVVLGFTASNCVIFSQYVIFASETGQASDILRKAVASGLLTVATLTHATMPKIGVKIQDLLGWVKIGIIMLMVLSGFYIVLVQPSVQNSASLNSLDVRQQWNDLWQGSVWNWGALASALFKVFFSYSGLDNLGNVLNEVRDPVRTLRSVTVTALFTSCFMFLLINVAYFAVVPVDEVMSSGELIAALYFERVFGGSMGRRILPWAVALCAAGNVFVVVFSTARLKQEIVRQGLLPFSDFLSSTNPFNSPLGGLMINYIPSLLVIVLPPSREVYSFILETEGYSNQIFGFLTGVGLIWLRIKRPDLKRPFKAWAPAVWVKIILAVALVAAPIFPPGDRKPGEMFYATYAILGMSTATGSILYWYIWTKLIPKAQGYSLYEETVVLNDGTSFTRIIRKY